MMTLKYFPEKISGEELDKYLASGWYRNGQSIFTTHMLMFGNKVYSAIWIRTSLEGYVFTKSLRKIRKKAEENFHIRYAPARLDHVKEELFLKYAQNFKGQLPPSLNFSLQDGLDRNVFNTFQVEIYDDDKLIAFSLFDLGKESIASIKAVYDPEYSCFSLGIYTLLLEIQYGIDNGFRYFYPGYIVPGYSRFDYKMRIAPLERVEFFHPRLEKWLSCTSLKDEKWPAELEYEKLMELLNELSSRQQDRNLSIHFHPYQELYTPDTANIHIPDSQLFIPLGNEFIPEIILFFDYMREKWCMKLNVSAEMIAAIAAQCSKKFLIHKCATSARIPEDIIFFADAKSAATCALFALKIIKSGKRGMATTGEVTL